MAMYAWNIEGSYKFLEKIYRITVKLLWNVSGKEIGDT